MLLAEEGLFRCLDRDGQVFMTDLEQVQATIEACNRMIGKQREKLENQIGPSKAAAIIAEIDAELILVPAVE